MNLLYSLILFISLRIAAPSLAEDDKISTSSMILDLNCIEVRKRNMMCYCNQVILALGADSYSIHRKRKFQFFEKIISGGKLIISFRNNGYVYIPFLIGFNPFVYFIDENNTSNFVFCLDNSINIAEKSKDKIVYLNYTENITKEAYSGSLEGALRAIFDSYKAYGLNTFYYLIFLIFKQQTA